MNNNAFQAMWSDIHLTFGAPPPQDRRKDIVFERVKNIPDAAARWIAEYIGDQDRKPMNMSKAIIMAWHRWQEEHPELMRRDDAGCSSCYHGFITVLVPVVVGDFIYGRQLMRETVVRCGYCQSGASLYSKLPRMTNAEIEHHGWVNAHAIGPVEKHRLMYGERKQREAANNCRGVLDAAQAHGINMDKDKRRVSHVPEYVGWDDEMQEEAR